MAPFDRPYSFFYWSTIANSSIWYRFWVILRWMICVEPWNLGYRSMKIIETSTVSFKSLGAVSYLPSIVTCMALSSIIWDIKRDNGRKSCIQRPRYRAAAQITLIIRTRYQHLSTGPYGVQPSIYANMNVCREPLLRVLPGAPWKGPENALDHTFEVQSRTSFKWTGTLYRAQLAHVK